jgi:DMSO/TMAO reductase YedYZ molybdopterin-dependent catalytic subunit
MQLGARINRRAFLDVLVGAAVMGAGSSTIDGAQSGPRHLLQLSGYPLDLETPLEAFTSYLTPNDLFFVRTHWAPTRVDSARWSLTVDGEVSQPLISRQCLEPM